MITQNRLRDLLHYDAPTGIFRWRVSRNSYGRRIQPWDVAGHPAKNGYILIGLEGRVYRAHRLAWLYMHGVMPGEQLDHKDGVRSNNALSNLRELAVAGNAQNVHRAHRDSASGLLGVEKHTQCDRYAARICVNGKRKYLGLFKTAEEAHAAYLQAKQQEHPNWEPKHS